MDLTDREKEALIKLASVEAPEEVASAMGISPATLVNHVRNVLAKLEEAVA